MSFEGFFSKFTEVVKKNRTIHTYDTIIYSKQRGFYTSQNMSVGDL